MHMCGTTALYTIIMVFAITAVGFLIGKLNKFGDKDEIFTQEEEKKK